MAITIIELEDEIDTQEEFIIEMEFVAGRTAPAGTYEDIETRRVVVLPKMGILPASCDGRVAVYCHKSPLWGEVVQTRRDYQEKSVGDLVLARPNLRFIEHDEELAEEVVPELAAEKNEPRERDLLAA